VLKRWPEGWRIDVTDSNAKKPVISALDANPQQLPAATISVFID